MKASQLIARHIRLAFLFAACLTLMLLLLGGAALAHWQNSVTPTNQWIDSYSTHSSFAGQPLPVGAVVAVFDPQGTQCGEFTVHTTGYYGLMPCYGDDPDTPADEGAVAGDALHFTINGVAATTTAITHNDVAVAPDTVVTWNQHGERWQVDLDTVGSLGDYIWWDIDHNGIQDAGEPGIGGVAIALADGVAMNATTDANGIYTFTNLAADTYTLTVTAENFQPGGVLNNWIASPVDAGNDNIDSDGNESTHNAAVTLGSGETNPDMDFGFYLTSSYTLTKQSTNSDVRSGQPISFTITITNTGDSWLTTLPLTDTYDAAYLSYKGNATPATDDDQDDGQIAWSDVTTDLGDVAPGNHIAIAVWFDAVADTSDKPGGVTTNTITAHDVLADPDGSGSLPPLEPLDVIQGPTSSSASVSILKSTGIFVNDFSAASHANAVRLSWETVSELNITGFRLLRHREDSAESEMVGDFIPARWSGMNHGASYQTIDPGLKPGVYSYALQSMLFDGSSESYGPVRVVSGASLWLPILTK